MRRVLVIDTSILCVWLGVSGKETCGAGDDRWDRARVAAIIAREEEDGATFVLPLATILETGNHIAQGKGNRHAEAKKLADLMAKAADGMSPWAAFTHQTDLWGPEALRDLAKSWPPLAAQRLSIGDATIESVASFYERAGYDVEIMTGDRLLKARQPAPPPPVPRRRR
ncbi:MAG TPA: hypothetical protein VE093_33705 [Polyangiaceae bacterium]|jgi:hypothetical protein|nr:hypothetical protein [Polyangiaceae bacterium]